MMRFLIMLTLLSLSACGVKGQLYLPEEKAAAKPATQGKNNAPQPPFKKAPNNATNNSVQKSDAEKEMMQDPFFTVNPNGEYDIRGNIYE